MGKKLIVLSSVLILSSFLWGCGDSSGPGDDVIQTSDQIGDLITGDDVAPDRKDGISTTDDSLLSGDDTLGPEDGLESDGTVTDEGLEPEDPEEPELVPRDLRLFPKALEVQRGTTEAFYAYLDGEQNNDAFQWELVGQGHGETTLGADGLLTVSPQETADVIVVMIKLKEDNRQTANAVVRLSDDPIETYDITVIRGVSEHPTSKAGRLVQVTATEEKPDEFIWFESWKADGDDVEFIDSEKTPTFFVMPERDVEISSVYYLEPVVIELYMSIHNPANTKIVHRGGRYLFRTWADTIWKGETIYDPEVTWSVTGNDKTYFDEDNWLHVAEDETAEEITITITSVPYPTVSKSLTLPISQDPAPAIILSVRIAAEGYDLTNTDLIFSRGDVLQFHATVDGFGPYDDSITWDVIQSGGPEDLPVSTITQDGLLTISDVELSHRLWVFAISNQDEKKMGSAWVFVAQPFEATVVNGSGSGIHEAGTKVPIAAEPPPDGYVFSHWTVEGCETYLYGDRWAEAYFIMPHCNVTITGHYRVKPNITKMDVQPTRVTLERGTRGFQFTGTIIGTGDFWPYIEWDCNSTKSWIDDSDGTLYVDSKEPADEIVVTAYPVEAPEIKGRAYVTVINKRYELVVTGGTGSGQHPHGTTVTITANPPAGQVFVQWEHDGLAGGKPNDIYAATTTLTMPQRKLNITAKFMARPSGSISIHGQTLDYDTPCLKPNASGTDYIAASERLANRGQCHAFFDVSGNKLYLKKYNGNLSAKGLEPLKVPHGGLEIIFEDTNKVVGGIQHNNSGRLNFAGTGTLESGPMKSQGTLVFKDGLVKVLLDSDEIYGIYAQNSVLITDYAEVMIRGSAPSKVVGIQTIDGATAIGNDAILVIDIFSRDVGIAFGVLSGEKISAAVATTAYVEVKAGGYGYIVAEAFGTKPILSGSYTTTGSWNSSYVKYEAK